MPHIDLSIIVPLYKGNHYIGSILDRIERCCELCRNKKFEVIFINDYPQETIEIPQKLTVPVLLFTNTKNNGIHASRLKGMQHASGSYVLFLDQDDSVMPEYILSQLSEIKDADAVVCRLFQNGRLHYTDTFRFSDVITRDFMITRWCSIVSPGQVIIKKKAIPELWKKSILKNNGADDYFLWLLMFRNGSRFVLNDNVLFEHVINGQNASSDTNRMMDSEEEMIDILISEKVYAKGQMDVLRKSLREIHVKQLEQERYCITYMKNWYESIVRKGYVYRWLEECRGKAIAIYGAGETGQNLYKFLFSVGINISCFIDQNARYIIADIKTYTLDECNLKLEYILLSIDNAEIEQSLQKKYCCDVISLGDISER